MGGNGSLNLLDCWHSYHELKVVSSQKRKSKSLLSHWKFLSSQVQLAQPPSSGQLILAMPGDRPIIRTSPFGWLETSSSGSENRVPEVLWLIDVYPFTQVYPVCPSWNCHLMGIAGIAHVHPFSTHPYVASEAQKEGPRGDKRISAHATWLQGSNSSDEQVVRTMKTCVIQKKM